MTRYSKLVSLTEDGRAVAEVYRHDGEVRFLVERTVFGRRFLPMVFNKPLVNLDRAHEWADAKLATCEWAAELLHREERP